MGKDFFVIRRVDPSEIETFAHELAGLQRRAYAIESELIGDDRIPQLTETPADLAAAGLLWQVIETEGIIVAAIAYAAAAGGIEIERLVVDPEWHRRGLARALLTSLPSGPVVVSTGRDNPPARRLYESLGFQHVGDSEAAPRLWISHYSRV